MGKCPGPNNTFTFFQNKMCMISTAYISASHTSHENGRKILLLQKSTSTLMDDDAFLRTKQAYSLQHHLLGREQARQVEDGPDFSSICIQLNTLKKGKLVVRWSIPIRHSRKSLTMYLLFG